MAILEQSKTYIDGVDIIRGQDITDTQDTAINANNNATTAVGEANSAKTLANNALPKTGGDISGILNILASGGLKLNGVDIKNAILNGAVGGGLKVKAMDLLGFYNGTVKQSYIQFEHEGQTNEGSGLFTIIWGKTNVAGGDELTNISFEIPYPMEYYFCPVAISNSRVIVAGGSSSSRLQLRTDGTSASYQVTWIGIGR